jgi:hypothetical protein
VVALSRSGTAAELFARCGTGAKGKLPPGRLWTVDLASVESFEMETNLADMAAGSVVDVPRSRWAGAVRVDGWDGYFRLGVRGSYLSNGPGSSACAQG